VSDHHSPPIFAWIFEHLAKNPTEENKKAALEAWHLMFDFDFWYGDMHCDKALEKLGLARKKPSKEYPEEGERWFYGPEGKDRE